ncbi:uncharacterized protein LOC110750044 isoform X6 [Prunus avium]|uniref:Uncharacterized protein LOC110750044 isoform X6 n=1 Tax=Prunus avium TaxID=42229 RepID=A0A6P5RWB2_PRUAV|nr:uncharacterized protein LOC110750044 isoform X6 [Prunus avium]
MEAMSLCIWKYPFCKLGFVNTRRTLYRTRLNVGLALSPSPVLLHTDGSGKFQEYKKGSGSNTVGIIGGLSVNSTLNFLRNLINWSSRDGESCPPFVLCSDPALNKELLSIERPSFPSVISKNEEGCSVPFLHMGECVAKELKEAKLKPLEAGSPLQIGVIATYATLKAGFYQEKLRNEGFEVVLPDKATMEHTVIPAIEALNRKDIEGAQNLLRIAVQVLLVRAANTVILASDDMRDLLPPDDPLVKKCIDPMDALARSTIKWAQSAKEGDGAGAKTGKSLIMSSLSSASASARTLVAKHTINTTSITKPLGTTIPPICSHLKFCTF